MSEAATPLLRSTAATDRAAALAWRSAVATEPALVCTPIDRDSWFGTPDTLPLPVTVMRAAPAAGTAVVTAVLPAASLAAAGAAPPWPTPRANAAMSRPAEATPAAAARWTGENWTAMVPLRRHVGMGHRLDAGGTLAGSRVDQAVGPLPSQPRRQKSMSTSTIATNSEPMPMKMKSLNLLCR